MNQKRMDAVPRFANVGTIGALPGRRDDLLAILLRRNEALRGVGCLAYEVGISEDDLDTIFVVELWDSKEAHTASLRLPQVQAVIEEARPIMSGVYGGYRFSIAGSPLRD